MTSESVEADRRQAETDLVGFARLINAELGKLNYVQAGFLFRSFLDEYVIAVEVLVDQLTKKELKIEQETYRSICRRLCQLSRDILYSITPDVLPDQLRLQLQELFQRTASLIPHSSDVEIQEYKSHIAGRTITQSASRAPTNKV